MADSHYDIFKYLQQEPMYFYLLVCICGFVIRIVCGDSIITENSVCLWKVKILVQTVAEYYAFSGFLNL